ncbi:protein ABIL2-like [Rhodamnia argentea]|uniref:Protein ABIL2-like n=1 Tax=Rhodamnia argentea TaxID=178133 RepID=A0A8B8QPP9_9MYRT|nr:protein ABIL2-like [Rhodamnia argentea]XP_030549163.1 protein ABIL2-like [Rhodamnia argentea]XP_048137651.1 protein ABIL2-like [Rhodamnia argentea]
MGMMTASSFPISHEASNYDEVSMQQSLLFSDSLKDLKNLRTQLYSAAEYFEMSYTNDDQKQIVVETLRDYAIKALVNTVDHLGSVTYKVNDLLDEKVDEVSGTEFRVSCIEQRLRTCQEYIDHEGRSQQSLVIDTPKYHKRYILPVGETMRGSDGSKLKYGCSLDDEDEWHHFKHAIRATIRDTPTQSFPSKGRSRSPSPRPPQRSGTFSFTSTVPKKELDKRTVSPNRFPLLRSGSLSSRPVTPKSSRPTTPNPSRPTTPNLSIVGRRYPSEPRKSFSMRLHAERENGKPIDQHPSKSKRLLKALLSRRKSKKDDMLYTYLDEY